MNEDTLLPLLAGERIIWRGRPYTGLLIRPVEAFLIPFSLLWGGFVLFWNASVWTTNADLSFKLFGLPFLIAGLYMTIGRFIVDRYIRRRTVYLLTDRRVLIGTNGSGSITKSLDIGHLPPLEMTERKDGSGTIRFGSGGGLFDGMNGFGVWQPTFSSTPQFLRISDVRSVYEMILQPAGR